VGHDEEDGWVGLLLVDGILSAGGGKCLFTRDEEEQEEED